MLWLLLRSVLMNRLSSPRVPYFPEKWRIALPSSEIVEDMLVRATAKTRESHIARTYL